MDDQNDDTFFAKYLTKNQQKQTSQGNQKTTIIQTDIICNQKQNNFDYAQDLTQKQSTFKIQQTCKQKQEYDKQQSLKSQHLERQLSQNNQTQKHQQIQINTKNREIKLNKSKSQVQSQNDAEQKQIQNRFQILCKKYQQRNTNSPSFHSSEKNSNYIPRNQLQKHLTLSGEHLKQIESVLQQNQNKDKELFKTISFNDEKDERLIIKNSLYQKHNSTKEKQQNSQKFNYKVIQSESSQDDFQDQNIKKEYLKNSKINCYLDNFSLAQSETKKQNQSQNKQKFRMSQKIKKNEYKEMKENKVTKEKIRAQLSQKQKQIQRFADQKKQQKCSSLLNKKKQFSAAKQEKQDKQINQFNNCPNIQKLISSKNNKNDEIQNLFQKNESHCKACSHSKIQVQCKIQAELLQKMSNIQKIVNSLKKFKQSRQALQIESNQSKSISPTVQKIPNRLQNLQNQNNFYKQDQIKQDNFHSNYNQKLIQELKKPRSINQKAKRHHKKSSQISCNSQQTSKTSNFRKQIRKGKSTSLLTEIKLLKAQVQYLQQQKRLKQISQKQKKKLKRQKSRKKAASYSQTYLDRKDKLHKQVQKREKQNPHQQYYNNQTIKYNQKNQENKSYLKSNQNQLYYDKQNQQNKKINIEFNDLVPQQKEIKYLQRDNLKQRQYKKQKLYEQMIKIFPKNSVKLNDGQKKLFDLAMSWYNVFLPQQLEIQNMSITKFDKFVYFKTNLLNFDIIWFFKGNFYCGETVQIKSTFKNLKHNNKNYTIHKQGEGVEILLHKYAYKGQFKQNKKSGYGIINFQNGNLYQGNWQENQMSGFGKFISSQCDIYEGQMQRNQKHGFGKQYFKNGDKYKGQYMNGLFNGKGKYKWFNGSSYKGEFKDGQLNGIGTWKSGFGDRYEGEYKNNLKHGFGVYEWKNGTKYQGYFQNGMKISLEEGKLKFNKRKRTSNKNKNKIQNYRSVERLKQF